MTNARLEPDPARVELLVQALAPGAVVVAVERLGGGLDNGMHAITYMRESQGERERVVVRRYGLPEHDPAARARMEARLLERLARAGIPVPEPVLEDPAGEFFDVPANVIRWLDGVPVAQPDAIRDWCEQLADVLARVHRVALPPGTAWEREPLPPAAPFLAQRGGERLYRALERARSRLQPMTPTLIHRDFHAGNVLWRDGRIMAVVDWDFAGVGDPAEDVGYAWMDLALQGERSWADRLVAAYLERNPLPEPNVSFMKLLALTRPLPDPAIWLSAYHEAGQTHLTAGALRDNLAALIRERVQRG